MKQCKYKYKRKTIYTLSNITLYAVYSLNTNKITIHSTLRPSQAKSSWKRKQLLNVLKVNGCAICGYNKCNAALDFHHSNPKDKKYHINQGMIARKDIIDELNKCILLCSNCHREIEETERKNAKL